MTRSLPVLILVLAFVVACGGSTSTPSPAPDDGSGSDDGSGAATSEPTTVGSTAAPGGAAATPAGVELTDLQKKRKAATFKVAYEWKSTGGGTPTSETWYHKGPLSRVDWGEPGQPSFVSHYAIKDGAFLCETSGTTTTCFKTAAATTPENPEEMSFAATLFLAFEGFLTDPSFTTTRESRSIAGQTAACWKSGAVVALGLAEVTMCHQSQTGVPLLFEWKAGNDAFTMTAKTYSTTVADTDFVLPVAPLN